MLSLKYGTHLNVQSPFCRFCSQTRWRLPQPMLVSRLIICIYKDKAYLEGSKTEDCQNKCITPE